jgi:hypothetical protein
MPTTALNAPLRGRPIPLALPMNGFLAHLSPIVPLAVAACVVLVPAVAEAHAGHKHEARYTEGERDFFNAIRVSALDLSGSDVRGHTRELIIDVAVISGFRIYYADSDFSKAPLGAFGEKSITFGISTAEFIPHDPLTMEARRLENSRPYFFNSDLWVEAAYGQLTRGEGALKAKIDLLRVSVFASWGTAETNTFGSQWQLFLAGSVESKMSGDFDFMRITLTAGTTVAMGFSATVSYVNDSSDAIDSSYIALGVTVGVPTLLGGLWELIGKETSSPH